MIENQMANLTAGTDQMSNLILPQLVRKPHAIRAYPLEDFEKRPDATATDGRKASGTAELSLRIELGRTQIGIDDSRSNRIVQLTIYSFLRFVRIVKLAFFSIVELRFFCVFQS